MIKVVIVEDEDNIGEVIELIKEKVLEDEFAEELVNKAMELQYYEKVKDK